MNLEYYLNECLSFMHENMHELPEVIPQHIIQHFYNKGLDNIELVECISFLKLY